MGNRTQSRPSRQTKSNIHLDTALNWLDMGFSPLPPREDGTKAPLADIPDGVDEQGRAKYTWSPYQTTPATRQQVIEWYRRKRTGNGVCGGVGGLEPFEFDVRATYEQYKEAAVAIGLGDLVERIEAGYSEESPSGGIHWMYVCSEVRPPAKLAERPIPGEPHKRKTLIETKGQGGFIIVAPSNGRVHPSGKCYRLLRGRPDLIATITSEERDALWDLARTFDEMPEAPPATPKAKAKGTRSRDIKPGDAYEAEHSWEDILEPLGWAKVHTRGDVIYWRRPGKDEGISATTGRCKGLYVFTTSTAFAPRRTYTKFAAYALIAHGIDHDGDYSVAAAELARQGYGQSKPATRRVAAKPAANGQAEAESVDLVIRADSVISRKVQWLWPLRVPYSFITIFAGRTGVGKSFVALDIAARKTRGDCWPDGAGECCTPGNVLIISEDPHDFVLRPRLETMGAELSRVYFMTWEAMASYELQDTEMLDRLVRESGDPDLIIIDPPTNFLGAVDEHRNAEVRGVLMKLVAWMTTRPKLIGLILITQVTKGTKGKEVEAVNRIIGSVAWAATSRIAHTFGADQDSPGAALFACPKSNLGPLPKTLGYRIVPRGELAIVQWEGESDKSADEVMNGRPKGRADDGAKFLVECFRKQLEWSSEDLFKQAESRSISRNAVFEAKKELDLPKARKRGLEWVWWVPPDWPHLKEKTAEEDAP